MKLFKYFLFCILVFTSVIFSPLFGVEGVILNTAEAGVTLVDTDTDVIRNNNVNETVSKILKQIGETESIVVGDLQAIEKQIKEEDNVSDENIAKAKDEQKKVEVILLNRINHLEQYVRLEHASKSIQNIQSFENEINLQLSKINGKIEEHKKEVDRLLDNESDEEEPEEEEPVQEVQGEGPCAMSAQGANANEGSPIKCCRMGEPCAGKIDRALREAEEICEEASEKAHKCCLSPESCIPGGVVTTQILSVAGQANAASGDSMSETCKKLKQSFTGFASINSFMAASCKTKARRCRKQCNSALEEPSIAFKRACGVSLTKKGPYRDNMACDYNVYEEYQDRYRSLKQVPKVCKEISLESNRKSAEVAGQLAGLYATAKACKISLAGEESLAPTPCTFGCPTCTECKDNKCQPKTCGPCEVCRGGDGQCSSLCITGQTCNTETKLCEFNNNDGGTTSPAPPISMGTPGGLGGGGTPDGGGLDGQSLDGGLPSGMPQQLGLTDGPFVPGDFDPGSKKPSLPGGGSPAGAGGLLGSASGGGGGGGGGLGGSGGGGGGGYGGAGGEEGAYPNEILQGFKGGKFGGYGGGGSAAASGGKKGAGGYKGYGGRQDKSKGKKGRKKRKLAKLDLKKLLPKNKKLDKARGKFGSVHDNIFQRVSNRVQVLCRKSKMNCR